MPEQRNLEPGPPAESDVEPTDADFSRTEGAHVLASEARDQLTAAGFREDQILDWAESYVSETGGGSVDAFITWVEDRQAGS